MLKNINVSGFVWFLCPFHSKEQQKSLKTMSIWEQRANQLRRQNRASCEALYCELDLEERLHLSSALHIQPDVITHLDRPLVIEPRDQPFLGSQQYQNHNLSMPEEAETYAYPPPPRVLHQHRRHHHHHHRDRDQARARDELNGNGDTSKEGVHHVHHSHFNEGKNERSRSQEASRRHHHHSSVGDNRDGGVTKEREHRHHHSHRQPRGGNGTLNDRRRAEHRSYHKDGSSLNRDGEKNYRGESGASKERKKLHPHGSRGQSTAEGEEFNKKEKIYR